ncbi:MAG: Gfo/Idh/MocA family oxidoreductase [Bryobacteraceae bacterium]
MATIRTAIIGTGFMGKVHREAIRRLGNVDVVAVAGETDRMAADFAAANQIARFTGDWKSLVGDKEVEAVHIVTPNATHAEMAIAFAKAGQHVLCEKPLAMTSAEAKKMLETATRNGVVHATNHNLRCYPMVQHAREMIAAGDLGDVLIVQGTYYQDWLLYETDYNWRIHAGAAGALRCVGDVGSHWMDMIQHVTGLRITALCADLQTFHKKRKKPKGNVETFSAKLAKGKGYEEYDVDTEDFGACLVRLGDRARGAYSVSQVSAGCKNRFEFEVFGTKAGLRWNQETPDLLWIGHRNEPNQIIVKDPSLMKGKSATYADLPGGHSEGYDDAHKQLFRRFYAKIADPKITGDFPTFADGLWGMNCLDAILKSQKKQGWVKL